MKLWFLYVSVITYMQYKDVNCMQDQTDKWSMRWHIVPKVLVLCSKLELYVSVFGYCHKYLQY